MKSLSLSLLAAAALGATAYANKVDVDLPPLKDAFAGKFLIGATLGGSMLTDPEHPALAVAAAHFNSLSPANAMKWAPWNPAPGEYNYAPADTFVEFGAERGMALIGHTLFWHSQTPKWVYEDAQGNPLTRDALLDRMRQRARHMAERYGDRVKIWDVVNESIESDGSLRRSRFNEIIGDDFNEQAFRIAAEELPADAVLLYNDYGMTDPGRRDAVVAMVKDFQAKGVRIDGIGMQGHWGLDFPSLDQIEQAFQAYASTGLPIHITELDIEVLGRGSFFGANVDMRTLQATPENNPYPDGNLPDEIQQTLADRYGEIFALMLKHADNIDRVTFWGVADGDSWLNNWPVRGRTNYPLLFDRNYQPKPAFFRLLEEAKKAN